MKVGLKLLKFTILLQLASTVQPLRITTPYIAPTLTCINQTSTSTTTTTTTTSGQAGQQKVSVCHLIVMLLSLLVFNKVL